MGKKIKRTITGLVTVSLSAGLFFLVACNPPADQQSQPVKNTELQSSQAASTPAGGTVLARIGKDEVVTWEEFNKQYRLDRMGRTLTAAQVERLLDNYINQRLVYLEGLEQGYDKNPEVLEQLERTKIQLISRYVIRDLSAKNDAPDDAKMREYYDANQDKFEVTEINYLLFNSRKFEGNLKKARAEAEKALAALKKGDDFAAVTEQFTGKKKPMVMTARKNQGSFFGPEFDNIAWSLDVGKVSDIVEVQQGFLIVKITSRDKQTFEKAKPYIVQDLTQGSGQNKIESFYSELRNKYPVKVEDAVLKSKLPKPSDGPPTPGAGPDGAPLRTRPPMPGVPPGHPGKKTP